MSLQYFEEKIYFYQNFFLSFYRNVAILSAKILCVTWVLILSSYDCEHGTTLFNFQAYLWPTSDELIELGT